MSVPVGDSLKSSWRLARSHWPVILGWLLLLWSIGAYAFNRHRFRDVESWPSTPLIDIRGGSTQGPQRVGSDGNVHSGHEVRWLSYEYVVDGQSYKGHRAQPGDGTRVVELTLESMDPGPWFPDRKNRVYFHPQHPEIAVLYPVPYQSSALVMTIIVSGIFVALHSYFHFRTQW